MPQRILNMESLQILVVDDEPSILRSLKYSLSQEGCNVITASSGTDALKAFAENEVDLIILDLMLPEMDGMQVCQRIRETSNVPIIMLTAKAGDMDRILGLEYGADDYISKPFNIMEVKARIKAVLRRGIREAAASESQNSDNIIRIHDLEINIINRTVILRGEEVHLTVKEFDLLQLFATNRGKVFTREEMLDMIWKYDYAGDARTVDVHIRRLRQKIEQDNEQQEFIFTKWGVGYYFTDRD